MSRELYIYTDNIPGSAGIIIYNVPGSKCIIPGTRNFPVVMTEKTIPAQLVLYLYFSNKTKDGYGTRLFAAVTKDKSFVIKHKMPSRQQRILKLAFLLDRTWSMVRPFKNVFLHLSSLRKMGRQKEKTNKINNNIERKRKITFLSLYCMTSAKKKRGLTLVF